MLKKIGTFLIKVILFTVGLSLVSLFIPSGIYKLFQTIPAIQLILPLAIVLTLILLHAYDFFSKSRPVVKQVQKKTVRIEESKNEENQEEKYSVGIKKIAYFFMKIYKFQLEQDTDAISQIIPVESKTIESKKSYKFKVAKNKEWVSRHMTVGTVGEDSGSRSQCYYAIYDDHLVIKIPPKPLTDFKQYIHTIMAGQKIEKKLAPRECLVPSVSSVMRLIHSFTREKSLQPQALENKYFKWLFKYPAYQEYLKIGDSFVFIMDLSKYFFLGEVLKEIHNLKIKLQNEIIGNPDVIWETYGFEGRYGFDNNVMIEKIKDIYDSYKNKIIEFQQKSGFTYSIPRFTLQKWFLFHLAGKSIDVSEKNVSPDFIAKINRILSQIIEDNQEVINRYRLIITASVQKLTVDQNKTQMGGLITNLLDLLVWLKQKGISMRDLKPDNLLIAGDRNKYPEFLNNIDDYTIGLIDVETAVDYRPPEGREVSQPILGGTPSYSTPSHLYLNKLLGYIFSDYRRILYLQDWYAGVGMIYEIITGEILFTQTGKMIVGIKEQMQNSGGGIDALTEVFKKGSQMFWYSASSELNKKLQKKAILLKAVNVYLLDNVREMFCEMFLLEKQLTEIKIKKYIESQEVFNSEKNRQDLLRSPHKNISALKEKWIKNTNIPRDQMVKRSLVIKLLQDLEQFKIWHEKQVRLNKTFQTVDLKLNAYDLIKIIFDYVLNAMYPMDWGPLTGVDIDTQAHEVDDSTYEATI